MKHTINQSGHRVRRVTYILAISVFQVAILASPASGNPQIAAESSQNAAAVDLNRTEIRTSNLSTTLSTPVFEAGSILTGHTGPVYGVAFNADGTRLVSGGGNYDQPGEIFLWEAGSGKQLLRLNGHNSPVYSVAFSPDGKRLASASGDRTVRLWDAETGVMVQTLDGHSGEVYSIGFSPDGKWLASAGGAYDKPGELKIWDLTTGKEKLALGGHYGSVLCVAFSPDGSQLASAGLDRTVRLWETATGMERRTFAGHAGRVVSVSFNSDGTELVSASGDRTVRVWETASGNEELTLDERREGESAAEVYRAVYSRSGQQVAMASGDGTVWLCDSAGQFQQELSGHTQSVQCVVFSPDGQKLASASADKSVRIWTAVDYRSSIARSKDSLKGLEQLKLNGHVGGVNCVVFSPDGQHLASGGGDNTVKVRNIEKPADTLTFAGHTLPVYGVSYNSKGTVLASASFERTVRFWDTGTGRGIAPMIEFTGGVNSVSFSPNGRWLAASDNAILIWDVAREFETHLLGQHMQPVRCVAFSPDSELLAAASMDQTITIWNVESGTLLDTLSNHTVPVRKVAWSADGKYLASAGWDRFKPAELKIWDTSNRQEVWRLPCDSPVESIAFSPNSRYLASGDHKGMVSLWDFANGQALIGSRAHSQGSSVNDVSYSPDGTLLASASADGTLMLWDVSLWQNLVKP